MLHTSPPFDPREVVDEDMSFQWNILHKLERGLSQGFEGRAKLLRLLHPSLAVIHNFEIHTLGTDVDFVEFTDLEGAVDEMR